MKAARLRARVGPGGGPPPSAKNCTPLRWPRERLFRRGVLSAGLRTGLRGSGLRGSGLRGSPREGRMSQLTIRFLTLALCATAWGVIPVVTPANAATSRSKHFRMHHQKRPGFSDPWSAGRASPVPAPSSQRGSACPGMGRGIDCTTWPPPMDDDPDRKSSSSDGG